MAFSGMISVIVLLFLTPSLSYIGLHKKAPLTKVIKKGEKKKLQTWLLNLDL